jgi:hypothetical protein
MLILALVRSPLHATCTPQLAPLTTGTFTGMSKVPTWTKRDVGTWRGEGWVGWSHGGDSLQSVRLKIQDVPKQHPDDADEVSVESAPHADYAVRCIAAVRPGPLPVGRFTGSLLSDRRLSISLGHRTYELRLLSTTESLADARIVLSDGRRTQVLYSADGFADDPHFDIEWAGDLDGDGRLDLVVNFSRKYSVHPYRLLLSSRASRGQLVGDAATFLLED